MAKPNSWRLGEQVYAIELCAKVDKKALHGYARLRRAVYVKTEMVRKLVNVENAPGDGAVPNSIFWTDFSSKRAEPLEVTALFAENEKRAKQPGKKRIADNITKGFVLTGEPRAEPAPAPEAPSAPEAAAPKKKAATKAK